MPIQCFSEDEAKPSNFTSAELSDFVEKCRRFTLLWSLSFLLTKLSLAVTQKYDSQISSMLNLFFNSTMIYSWLGN